MALVFKKIVQSVLILSILLSSLAQAQAKPQRIVSLSLCTDLLLLMLVTDKSSIASISYLSANPDISFLAQEAKSFTLNQAQAEEVLALNPDLILSSQFSATAATTLLKRLGHEVVVIGLPTTIDKSFEQIRQVAALIAEEARGEDLISQLQSDIAQSLANIPESAKGKTAVFYSSNGFSYGSDTLRNHMLMTLGLKNLAADMGMVSSGQLSLETLVMAKPDYLLVDAVNPHSDKLAHSMLQHPAIKQLFASNAIITVPDTLFQCAGPTLAEAFKLMTTALSKNLDE